MAQELSADICVIGAGSAGLSVAAVSAQLGARTVLIERARMGGDCLNTGCVPSKSLLAVAKAAHGQHASRAYGVSAERVDVDFKAVHAYVHGVIDAIAPHDSEERFRSLGCTVLRDTARFLDERTVACGDALIRARRFVLATGSRAALPPIPGIDRVSALTNETVFDLTECPRHLIVIGAGPIGCEMAQAFRRLGADVTIVEKAAMLPKDDPAAAHVVRAALLNEGIDILEGVDIERIEPAPSGVTLLLRNNDRRTIDGSHLLVAAGRRPIIEGLDLEKAGIEHSAAGIVVDGRLRTTNRRVFAAGDVAGGPQFTHVASYHAGIIIRNALFRLPAKINLATLPWVTYTDPELAQVGMTESAARAKHGDAVHVLQEKFTQNDRAQAEGKAEGFIKVVTDRKGRILGATIVGSHAGELIQSWCLAMTAGLRIRTFADMIAPYPTLGEINKRIASQFYAPSLFSARTRRLVRFLGFFG